MEKSKLLDRCGAEGEDRLLLAKVLDRAAQAEERNIPACTDFLSPQQQMMAGDLLRLAGIPETAWLRQGRLPGGGAEHPALSAGLDGAGDGGASRSGVCGRPFGRRTG